MTPCALQAPDAFGMANMQVGGLKADVAHSAAASATTCHTTRSAVATGARVSVSGIGVLVIVVTFEAQVVLTIATGILVPVTFENKIIRRAMRAPGFAVRPTGWRGRPGGGGRTMAIRAGHGLITNIDAAAVVPRIQPIAGSGAAHRRRTSGVI